MIDPLLIKRQIEVIDPAVFVQLATDVLSESAAANGIPRSCLATNLRLSDPDGGIDARCVGAPRSVGRMIPSSDVAYQFKSGGGHGARVVARDDILGKPRVVEALNAGAAFVYLMGWDVDDAFESEVTRHVRVGVDGVPGLSVSTDQIVCLGSRTFAQLLLDVPAVLWQFVGAGDADLLGLQQWGATRPMSNVFQTDTSVEGALALIKQALEPPRGNLRVAGPAGQGKTRLVLEALARSDLAPSVLYARDPRGLSPAFKAFLRRSPIVRCTIVVDECDDRTHRELGDTWAGMPPEVRLVTIGLGVGRSGERNVLAVSGLEEGALVRLIQSIAQGLPDEAARDMARLCQGSPKLAVLLAERVRDEPSLAPRRRLIRDADIQAGLERYLALDLSDPAWRALAMVAVVGSVGWMGEFEEQAQALFTAGGLEPETARRHVDALHDRFGIAPMAGRFRYVSPELLSLHLAEREIRSWTASRVNVVLQGIGSRLASRLARRLRLIAHSLPNRGAFERAVFESPSAESLGLIATLAAAFPWPALLALERFIEPASDLELRSATGIRRDLVAALEDLMWRADAFERAARLMLRLAVAENEPGLANNASGLLVETFQTHLGRTAAGSTARLRLLREMTTHADPTARRLGAAAIGAVVHTGHTTRMGMPPEDVEGMPAEAWQPKTWGEWWGICRQALELLQPLLADADPEVRYAARQALKSGVSVAYAPRVIEAWTHAAVSLREAPYDERVDVVTAVRNEIRAFLARCAFGPQVMQAPEVVQLLDCGADVGEDSDELSDDQQAEGEELSLAERAHLVARVVQMARATLELVGSDFSWRFRQAVRRNPYERRNYDEEFARVAGELAGLAHEGIAQPDLVEREWGWLSEDYMQHAFTWPTALGTADSQRRVAEGLERRARVNVRCAAFLSLYELAQSTHRGMGWIDERAVQLSESGAGVLAFDLMARAGYSLERVDSVIQLLASGTLAPGAVSMLAYAPWGTDVPVEDVSRLVEAARTAGADIGSLLELLWRRVHQHPEAHGPLQTTAVQLLAAYAEGPGAERGAGVLNDHAFYEIAKMYALGVPSAVMQAVMGLEANQEAYHRDHHSQETLRAAWAAGDKETLLRTVITPALERDGLARWRLLRALEGFPIGELDIEVLARWLGESPENRVLVVATMLRVPHAPVSDAHALLLEKFGEFGVGGTFFGNLISGVFMGSAAARTRALIESVRPMLSDPRPAVREWAEGALASLEGMLTADERGEAEELARR
jgi:hypothetical protein